MSQKFGRGTLEIKEYPNLSPQRALDLDDFITRVAKIGDELRHGQERRIKELEAELAQEKKLRLKAERRNRKLEKLSSLGLDISQYD